MQEVALDGEMWVWVFSSSEEKIQKIQLDKKKAEKKEITLLGKQGILGRRKKLKERLSLLPSKEFQIKGEKARLIIRDAVKKISPFLSKDLSFLLLREKNLSNLRGEPSKEIKEIPPQILFSNLESLVLNTFSSVDRTGITREVVEDIIWVVYLNLSKTLSLLMERSLGEGELYLLEDSVISLALLLREKEGELPPPTRFPGTKDSSLLDNKEFSRRRELLERTLKFPAVKTNVGHC